MYRCWVTTGVRGDPARSADRRGDDDRRTPARGERRPEHRRAPDRRAEGRVGGKRVVDPVDDASRPGSSGGCREGDVDDGHGSRRRRDPGRRVAGEDLVGRRGDVSLGEPQQPPSAARHRERLERRRGRERVGDHEVILDVLAAVARVHVSRCTRHGHVERRGLAERSLGDDPRGRTLRADARSARQERDERTRPLSAFPGHRSTSASCRPDEVSA